jgi:hypothetical protein
MSHIWAGFAPKVSALCPQVWFLYMMSSCVPVFLTTRTIHARRAGVNSESQGYDPHMTVRVFIDGVATLADLAGEDDSGLIPKSVATTKGDLLAASGSATVTRLGVGSDTQVLTADSSQLTGMKWAAGGGGGGGTGLDIITVHADYAGRVAFAAGLAVTTLHAGDALVMGAIHTTTAWDSSQAHLQIGGDADLSQYVIQRSDGGIIVDASGLASCLSVESTGYQWVATTDLDLVFVGYSTGGQSITADAVPPTLPLVVAGGVNDTFQADNSAGTIQIPLVPGSYANAAAIGAAMASRLSSGTYGFGHTFTASVTGGKITLSSPAYADQITLSTGTTNDVLAGTGFTTGQQALLTYAQMGGSAGASIATVGILRGGFV